MNYICLDNENFDEILKKENVVVDFYASWCGPCKMFAPIFEEISKENENYTFVKVDVDKFEELARRYSVMSIPTVIRFKNGNILNKKIGFMNKSEFIKFISE